VSKVEQLGARPPAPVSDLFATAVHRFGKAWADLVVAAVIALALASLPVLIVASRSDNHAVLVASVFCYGVAYFALLGQVMLRGLPDRVAAGRVAATYACALVVGLLAGLLVLVLLWLALPLLPLLVFAVPAVAAGDHSPSTSLWASARLALSDARRVWAVWLITIAFSGPIVIAWFLFVQSFSGAVTGVLLALALAAPIAWPFSALFIRALYGDMTGRVVVAPQDRTR
jgi:signal transduction histidine kinase